MINIEKLLNECSVQEWQINGTKTESYELFFVHSKLETVRATDTDAVSVTIFVDHDGKKGQASFKLYASTTEDEAKAKIESAVAKAALISNEYFSLPEGEKLDGVIESNLSAGTPVEIAASMAEAVFSADMLDHGTVNALEIFINKYTVTVKNSLGMDKRAIKYSAMIEAIPTWNEGESVELYEAIRTAEFDFQKIREEISAKMREVRDRGQAKAPEAKLNCPVVLPAEELSRLFGELAYNLNYATVYTKQNPFSEGDTIQKSPVGDKITVTMKGQLKGSTASELFDSDGVTLVDTKVIDSGVACSYFGGSRFAQYLGRNATGNLSCYEVEAGSLSNDELTSRPYFECVSMSGLQLDVYNDYIGGEVRLAYYFDGEKKIPVTGISISGKLSEALNTVRLSTETTQSGRYSGPALALFEGIEIV
jgi:PmbA protein